MEFYPIIFLMFSEFMLWVLVWRGHGKAAQNIQAKKFDQTCLKKTGLS